MGVLDRFEKGVERALSGTFSKAFKTNVKPVDISVAIRRNMDDNTAALSRGRTVVPNAYTVELGTAEFDQIHSWGAEALADEMVAAAEDHAREQGYVFVGPVEVTFTENPEAAGGLTVESTSRRGAVAPATTGSASRRHPILDIDGQRYLLTGPVTVIGRGSEADIVVDDTGISRRHLEIRITPDGVVASDLGSTNGTFVEGHRVPAATLVDGNTLTIGRTRILFWTGSDEPQ
ncbi:MAG: FhaA domain-containing protein [Beutenbergiaceae bacterium]